MEKIDARGWSLRAAVNEAVALAVSDGITFDRLGIRAAYLDADWIRVSFEGDAALFWDKPGILLRTTAGPLRVEVVGLDGDPLRTENITLTRDGEPWCEIRIR